MPEKPHSSLFVKERLQPGPSLPTLLSQGEQPFLSHLVCFSAPAPSVALHWTLSSFPVPLLHWGPKTGHCSTASQHFPDCNRQCITLPFQLPLLWLSKTPGLKSCWTAFETSHCLFSALSFQLVKIVCVCVAEVNLNAMDRI